MESKDCVTGLLPEELIAFLAREGVASYRARQMLSWVYRKGEFDLGRMSDVPPAVRRICDERLRVVCLETVSQGVSRRDATEKYLLRTERGEYVESVYIPAGTRRTVCVSTQIGCPVRCAFCASGASGCRGSLSAGEIVSQVVLVMAGRKQPKPTNVVLMGMGEPLLNYDATVKAVRILNHPECLGLGARKITISTCGLPAQIQRLSAEGLQVELSLSLHAADDALRSRLVPFNRKYPLAAVMAAIRQYTRDTRRIVTFEYVLLGGVNDSAEHARQLARLLKGSAGKVNLIPFNAVSGNEFRPSSAAAVEGFRQTLERLGVKVTLRRSRGADISGACGQLRLDHQERP